MVDSQFREAGSWTKDSMKCYVVIIGNSNFNNRFRLIYNNNNNNNNRFTAVCPGLPG